MLIAREALVADEGWLSSADPELERRCADVRVVHDKHEGLHRPFRRRRLRREGRSMSRTSSRQRVS
jgi:hypothetical protein